MSSPSAPGDMTQTQAEACGEIRMTPKESWTLEEGPGRGRGSYCFLFSIFLADQKTIVGSEEPLFPDDLPCAHVHIKNL